MVSFSIVDIANTLQLLAIPLGLYAYLPQWREIVKNRSSKNVSLRSYLIWLMGSFFALFYAGVQVISYSIGSMLLLSTGLNFLAITVTVGLIIKFAQKEERFDFSQVSTISENIVSTVEVLEEFQVEIIQILEHKEADKIQLHI